MLEAFDAYYKWLGIDPEDQPPNHYHLLGIKPFQSDPDVIANAADKQMAHIRSFQTGQYSALSQKILNEIAAARICLLSAAKKAQYDEKLRVQLAASESQPQQAGSFDTSKIGLDFSDTKATSAGKRPRRSHATKLPWQLPAAIVAGLLASVAIIAYLLSKPPEGEKPVTQAKADAPSKQAEAGTKPKPKEDKPPRPESKPEAKPEAKELGEAAPPPSVNGRWVLLFRSSDPAVWNTDSPNKNRFAIPLAKAPEGIRFLKMQLSPKEFVVIAMTKDRLGIQSNQGQCGWEGGNGFSWGAHEFGVFDETKHATSGIDGICVAWRNNTAFSGWGFGWRGLKNDRQGFAWEGKEIEPTVLEIYVTSADLTPPEQKHLLK